jgi:hypothetical protein
MSEETCPECKEKIDTEIDYVHWSNVEEAWYCGSCYESDTSYCSTLYFISNGGVTKYYVGDAFIFDEYGDDPRDLTIRRTYHSTDAWRGYNETTVEGFVNVLDGWTTGGWGDSVARRKQVFNDWAQALIEGEVRPPFDVVIVFDPTSNVFSTAVTVLVREKNKNEVENWLNGEFDDLYNALS